MSSDTFLFDGAGDDDGSGDNPGPGGPTDHTGEGVRVSMRRIDQTKKGLLGAPFLFQVPPIESVKEHYGFTHTEYGTIGDGTFSRPAGRDLRTVSFGTMFVDTKYPWTLLDPKNETSWIPDPLEMKRQLVEILESGTPFMLTVHQRAYDGSDDVHWPATLRSLDVDQRAGELGTRYLDVLFAEYRDPTVQRRERGHKHKKGKRHLPATVHLLHDGRGRWKHHEFKHVTLSELARFFYGSPSKWKAIAHHNGLDIPANRPLWDAKHPLPARIKRSRKVVVPKLG